MDTNAQRRFDEFAALRGPGLHRLAVLLCGDWHRAEDIVQSALARAFLAWSRVERADDPDAYVRRIVVNACHSAHRRRRLRELSTGWLPDLPTTEPGPGGVDRRLLLVAALCRLPDGQRTAVVLRHVLDLTEAEVADLMGVSVGTVKSQTAKALAKLRAEPALLAEVGR
jgi:RNA polymerase sigma-70 factor (sigma-E family)